jgi:hypothetical protein
MMIRKLPIETLEDVMLVPRATLAKPIGHFAKKLGYEPDTGDDDLDYFKVLVLALNGDLTFMLSSHRNQNKSETVVSLPINISTARGIDAALGRVFDALPVPFRLVVWQQKNDDRQIA